MPTPLSPESPAGENPVAPERSRRAMRTCPRSSLGVVLAGLTLAAASATAASPAADYPIRPVPFTAVSFEDGFWAPRLETNRKVTVRHNFAKCETTGRIRNFDVAAGARAGGLRGALRLRRLRRLQGDRGRLLLACLQPDPELDAYLDGLIAKIAAAQEPDGYLYTAGRSRRRPEAAPARQPAALERHREQPRALQPRPPLRGRGRPLPGHRQAVRSSTWP